MVVERLFLFIADIEYKSNYVNTKSFTKSLTNFLINGIIYMSIIFLEDINEREIQKLGVQ